MCLTIVDGSMARIRAAIQPIQMAVSICRPVSRAHGELAVPAAIVSTGAAAQIPGLPALATGIHIAGIDIAMVQ
jgi:hypothetical protein